MSARDRLRPVRAFCRPRPNELSWSELEPSAPPLEIADAPARRISFAKHLVGAASAHDLCVVSASRTVRLPVWLRCEALCTHASLVAAPSASLLAVAAALLPHMRQAYHATPICAPARAWQTQPTPQQTNTRARARQPPQQARATQPRARSWARPSRFGKDADRTPRMRAGGRATERVAATAAAVAGRSRSLRS
jgi:hypothetical protein